MTGSLLPFGASSDESTGERPSFQRRLLVQFGPALVLALGVLALIAWTGAYLAVHRNAVEALETEIGEMRTIIGVHDTLDVSGYAWNEAHHRLAINRVDPIFVQVFSTDGRLIRQSANIDSLSGSFPRRRLPIHPESFWPSIHIFTVSGQALYYRTRSLRTASGTRVGFVQIARHVPEHRSLLWTFAGVLLGLWIVLSLGLLALVKWSARRVLEPLQSITAVAQSVTTTDLNERVVVPPSADRETATLGRAFNALLNRIGDHVAALQAFTANAAHELQTPLTALQGHVELALRRERDPERYRETLRLLERKLSVLIDTLRALLTLTRLDRDALVDISPVNLSALVGDEIEALQDAAIEKGLSLTVQTSTPVWTKGLPNLLHKAVRNIIDNAIKYTPGGDVVVTVDYTTDGQARFTCTDTGVGMTAEECKAATSRFYRGDGAAQVAEGSGLGLSLVQQIVNAHGGTLRLKSTPGKGTQAIILLPTAPSPHHSDGSDEPVPHTHRAGQ
ncbi:sensor histidine kinase [Salisaeta longa]|uniref:sensor histidine kinase n=1 Tax=Salisaeta longa TaxID=503170 RepID=UPI0003B71ADC|nr:HAMP domain-containing sensor histidine kinase [Salisaeta longa]